MIKAMKKILVFAVAIFSSTLIYGQKISEKDVPASIKAAFQKQYPGISKVKWEKEKENFEAEFESNKTESSALFDASGKLLESEVEIKLNELPVGVAEYVKSHYKGQKVKEAAKITDANGTITYEAEIKGKDLIFDLYGKFIKEVKEQ